jgi:hypothetical protein
VLDVDTIMRRIRQATPKPDISKVADGHVLSAWSTFRWTRHGATEPCATVECRLALRSNAGVAWLRYDVDHFSRRTGRQEQRLTLATTACRFGGVRWWWICPATGWRVRKLYLPNGGTRFLSRGPGAYMLAYTSQRQTWMDRSLARSRRLCRRLGADYYGAGGFWPPKPKGMRWRTYHAICDRLEAENGRLNVKLWHVSARLERRSRAR